MTLTLEDVEKLLQEQAAELKALKDQLALQVPPAPKEKDKIEERIAEFEKRLEVLHANYAKLTTLTTDEEHHCHWCQ